MKHIIKSMLFLPLFCAGAVQAGIITHSVDFSVTNGPIEAAAFSPDVLFFNENTVNSTLSISGFDSSLGKLTNVSITLFSTFGHFLEGASWDESDFDSANGTTIPILLEEDAYITVGSAMTLRFTLIDPSTASDLTTDSNATSCYGSSFGFFDNTPASFNPEAFCTNIDFDGGNFISPLDIGLIDINEFIGTDPLSFELSSYTGLSGGCYTLNANGDVGLFSDPEQNCYATLSTTWAGQVQVSYSYVPEPASLFLLASGLFGIGFLSRARPST